MKNSTTTHALLILITFVFALTTLGTAKASAQSLYFDAEGGTKTWDYTTENWSATSGGPYDQAWTYNRIANFEGTAGTVDVTGTISQVPSIIFAVGGYTIGAIPNDGNIMSSSGMQITTNTGSSTINSVITDYSSNPYSSDPTNINKGGIGTLVLNGVNTVSGSIYINEGILELGDANSLANATPVVNGGTLSFGSLSSVTLGGITANSGYTIALENDLSQPVALTFGGNTSTPHIGGIITGSGSLTKTGTSYLYMSGYGNTYTGDTKIAGGTLEIATPIWGSTLDYDNYGGEVAFLSGSTCILGGLKGSQDICLGNTPGAPLLIGANDQSTTYSGRFCINNPYMGSIGKIGYGTLTLSGENAHAGYTYVASGTLKLANTKALQYSTVSLDRFDIATFTPDGIEVTEYTGGILSFGSLTNAVFGGLYGPNNLSLDNDNMLPVALSVGIVSFQGELSGSGSLTITSGGILAGTNTYTGSTTVSAGTLNVTGSLTNNSSDKIFVAADGTNFAATISRCVDIDASYAGFGSTAIGDDALGTSADLISGINTVTGKSLSMQWRLRDGDELAAGLVSDVLNLSGMADEEGEATDLFTLQMSYSADALPGGAAVETLLADAGKIELVWFNDTESLWQNAALANFGAENDVQFMGVGYTPDGILGHWGIDVSTHTVWAVLDHNSQFAVAVPEPGTIAMFAAALLLLAVVGYRRAF